jgi:hypothetical protein
MNYRDQLKELRKRVPISIQEALNLLVVNQGNVDLVENLFIEQCINTICQQTSSSKDLALSRFKEQKYDLAKAISSIKEEQDDSTYIQPPFFTKDKLSVVRDWLDIEEGEGLYVALDNQQFDVVIKTLEQISIMPEFVEALKAIKKRQQAILAEYNNLEDIKEYIKYSNQLRSDSAYKNCEELIEQKGYIINRELFRHIKNVK